MQIYVINLMRAIERRQKMEAQGHALNLTLDFIDALDGKTITDADRALVDHARRRRITPYPLTDNEIGCCLSHRRAMQRLIESGKRMAVILEDDAILLPDFPRVLAAIEQRAAPFDVIDLYRETKKRNRFVFCRALLPGYALGRASAHVNAIAYVISRAGAQKFLAYAPRLIHAMDKEMHRPWVNGLNIYGLETAVISGGEGGYSFIAETRGAGAGKDRPRYDDADRFTRRFQRWRTRLADSILKRVTFPAYVRNGRQAW